MVIQLADHIPTGLGHLNISHNELVGPESMKYLSQKILDDPAYSLDSLLVEGCQIGDEGAEHLAEAITDNGRMRFLDISRNNISAKGAEAVGAMLSKNAYLTILFMHYNPIGKNKMGGVHIANGLKEN